MQTEPVFHASDPKAQSSRAFAEAEFESDTQSRTVARGAIEHAALRPGRLLVIAVCFAFAFAMISLRLFVIHMSSGEILASNGFFNLAPEGKQVASIVSEPDAFGRTMKTSTKRRSDIIDRNGLLLATDLKKPSLCANGRLIKDPAGTVIDLQAILPDLDFAITHERLRSNKACKFIRRAITREQQFAINQLGIVGLDFREEDWRVYPHANLTAHTVGWANPENIGLAGVEQSLNKHLREIDEPVQLAMDLRAQSILRDELLHVIDLHQAKAASGVLLNANTSEVVAMVSLPDFDPNNPSAAKPEEMFNKASLGVYELGSVLKVFTVAMGLESGQLDLNDSFDVSKPLPVKGTRFTIKDLYSRNESMNAEAILRYSSNIGAAKIADLVGQEVQKSFLRDVGLLTQLDTELPEIGTPIYPLHWREINTLTISYGHGVSFSPLQLANSTAALINGGLYRSPTFLKRDPQNMPEGKRVLSKETSLIMRRLMKAVVEEGTGKRARIQGYSVGGKTGTAEKPGRNASGKNAYSETRQLASFLGAFPIDKPEYVLLIVVDEPKANLDISDQATAGVVAAPVAKRYIERVAPLLRVLPDRPEELRSDLLQPEGEKTAQAERQISSF